MARLHRKLPSDKDKATMTKLLNDCYKYAVAINSHDHPISILWMTGDK